MRRGALDRLGIELGRGGRGEVLRRIREVLFRLGQKIVNRPLELLGLLAALGRAQLARLDTLIERRRQINHRYREELSAIEGIEFMPEAPNGRSNCWLTCLLLDEERLGVRPEQLRLQLEAHNIEARPVWKPMHLQPAYRDCRVVGGAVAEDLFLRGLCVPSGSTLSDEDQGRVLDAFLRTPGLASPTAGA